MSQSLVSSIESVASSRLIVVGFGSAPNGPYYGTVGRPQLRYGRLVNYDCRVTVKDSEKTI